MDSLYSAFIIEADNDMADRELFGYARSENVPCTQTTASNVHTNMPRSGWNGLPMGWEFRVTQWRANTNQRYLDAVLEYASEVSLTLHYNTRVIATTPLIDLLFAAHRLRWPFDPMDNQGYNPGGRSERLQTNSNLMIRENLSFRVDYQVSQKAHNTLATWLVANTMSARLMGWVWLEGQLTRPI